MKNSLISSLDAASHGARLAGAEVVPNFPAPYSNRITETLRKIHACNIIEAESQTSAINAAIGAELCEKRTFLPLSIPKCPEEFYAASFLRLPIVAANVSRSIFSYTTKSDHNAIFGLRDAGWLMFFPSSAEDVIYSMLQAYAIAEDIKVLLPAVVNIEQPFFRETVQIPSDQFAKKLVTKLRIPHRIDVKKPKIIAPVDDYESFVSQQQKAMTNARQLIEKMNETYGKKLKKNLGTIETYRMEDAEVAIVMLGFHSATAKIAIDRLREKGKKAGLLRVRIFRPWPELAIARALGNVKRIAVIDQDLSIGKSGILFSELKTEKFASNFIAFKYLTEKSFSDIVERLERQEKPERVWV